MGARWNLVRLAVVGEGALALAGIAWVVLRRLPLPLGPPLPGLLAGLGVAGFIAGGSYFLLVRAPDVAPVRSMRELYRDLFEPLFRHLRPSEIAAIALAAGIGEELLFRGAAQPDLGLAPATLLFGLAHVGGSRMIVFGAWAASVGLVLGLLAIATGGVLAPIVAHAVYDALALAYIVRHAPPDPDPEARCVARS